MAIRRNSIGFIGTAIWISAGLLYAFIENHAVLALRPNEFADLLAGFFAPLAFFWLILGYMQQGEELALNTEALRLQAEELKESAEQQRQLVAATREQLANERETLAEERVRMNAAATPRFLFAHVGASLIAGPNNFEILIANSGGAARPLSLILVRPDGSKERIRTIPAMETGSEQKIALPHSILSGSPLSAEFQIEYRNIWGEPGTKLFTATADTNHMLIFQKRES